MAAVSILFGSFFGFFCGLLACMAFGASFGTGIAIYFSCGLLPISILCMKHFILSFVANDTVENHSQPI